MPEVVHLCTDTEVLGVHFYVMECLHGHVVQAEFPPGHADSDEERRHIGENLVDAPVKLHAVDWMAVGLQDFGHPEGFMARQIRRWQQQWERSVTWELPVVDGTDREVGEHSPRSRRPRRSSTSADAEEAYGRGISGTQVPKPM